MTIIISISM